MSRPKIVLPGRIGRLVPLIADGESNNEIADELSLARHSVENYIS